MEMHECQKYEKCSANLCPLDKDLSKRSYCDGEEICFYMREHVKGNRGDSAQEKTIHQMIEFNWEVILDVGKSAYKKKLKSAIFASLSAFFHAVVFALNIGSPL